MNKLFRLISCLCAVSYASAASVTTGPVEQCVAFADLVFVMDASGSVGQTNYDIMKNDFLCEVVGKLDISPTKMRVGFIHYSSTPTEDFAIGNHSTREEVADAIRAVPYTGGGTATSTAIEMMRGMFSTQARKNLPMVGVILTDGKSNSKTNTISEANAAKDEGIDMVSVGIGAGVDLDELEGMATPPPELNVILTDFNDLVTVINRLANVICIGADGDSTIPDLEDVWDIPRTPCISDCTGIPNGYYQSCQGCDVYLTCSNEITYDGRPCPAGLVWDDGVKRCEYTSTTCK